MRSWIERVGLSDGFAGRRGPGGDGDPSLDRIKAMKKDGWNLTVLILSGEVLVLGIRDLPPRP